ncbi:MAG: methionine--tRNA ligase subunit beta [Candidatus Pacebacteria bacterium]|nr:methionine--tRNA ligase subunit beta [Candidatus Paceibacterota bacterium]
MITIDDFQKLDLRVGRVTAVEPVDGSDRLLKLMVDLGPEIGQRQIIAGLAQFYQPQDLSGRQIIVLVNLQPRSIKGHESQGMLLAADDGQAALLAPDKPMINGARVR